MGNSIPIPFLEVDSIDGLPEKTSLEPDGNMFYQDADGKDYRIKTDSFYQFIHSVAKPILPSDSGTFIANSWYKPSVYSADPGTNYPNAGNLKAVEGYDTLFYYTGSTWTKVSNRLPLTQGFTEKSFNYTLDLSKDTYGKYTELSGTITFSEGTGSVFGKIAYVKLTGGNVVFPSNFAPQLGTSDYDPAKTNVIAFWKEYDKVRYFIETFTLEPLPVDGLISYYNFNGKTPNALLSSIAPNFGSPFTGNTSGFRINSLGTQLQNISNATSGSDAIAIDVGGVINYKATLYVSLSQELEVNIGATAYNTWSDYINIQFMSTSRIQHMKPSAPAGEIIYSSSTIEYPNTRFYKWEFVVNGNSVTVFYEGNELVTYTHSNTGSLFSIIFKNANDNFQSIKIEEL